MTTNKTIILMQGKLSLNTVTGPSRDLLIYVEKNMIDTVLPELKLNVGEAKTQMRCSEIYVTTRMPILRVIQLILQYQGELLIEGEANFFPVTFLGEKKVLRIFIHNGKFLHDFYNMDEAPIYKGARIFSPIEPGY